MKITQRKLLSLAVLLPILVSMLNVSIAFAGEINPVKIWALIVSGTSGINCSNDTQYMYHTNWLSQS